jgi:hypothetical protein
MSTVRPQQPARPIQRPANKPVAPPPASNQPAQPQQPPNPGQTPQPPTKTS